MQANEENHLIIKARHNGRKGGLFDIPFDTILGYFYYITFQGLGKGYLQIKNWLPSVKKFKELIISDPVLRMNWQQGISKSQKTLLGKTGDDVLGMINTACHTPPNYSQADLVGFPINFIFVEFIQTESGRSFFSNNNVNKHLKNIMNDYQLMLLSSASLEFMNQQSPRGWFCLQARQKINYDQFICSSEEKHYGFSNWNEFFLKKFKPGYREVGVGSPAGSEQANVIVNSCESIPLMMPAQPQRNVKKTDNFWLKDNAYSLSDMLAAFKLNKGHHADYFEGGTVYQAYLNSLFYHRWHAPVNGTIEDIYEISGTYYLEQSQQYHYQESSLNKGESFLSSVATRKVVVINADNNRIGKIAIIYIGMAEVSSCVATVRIGDHVQKGDEIGHFQFGGSSHLMIFSKHAKLRFGNLYQMNSNQQHEALKQNLGSFLCQVIE